MELHTLSNRTEDPGSNFVFWVEKSDVKKEESENNDISIVFSHNNTNQEYGQLTHLKLSKSL